MDLDPDVVASLVAAYQPTAYLRVTPIAHRATPLGMGFGKTRFASPTDEFKLLYIAGDLATSLAEAIIRDRFEGATAREITAGRRGRGLGRDRGQRGCATPAIGYANRRLFSAWVSTEITGAKAQDEARQFSQALFDQTDLDGILYLSRLTRRTCVAVYDWAVAAKLDAGPVHELESLAALVPALAALRVVLI